jgi:hypothetical protein
MQGGVWTATYQVRTDGAVPFAEMKGVGLTLNGIETGRA